MGPLFHDISLIDDQDMMFIQAVRCGDEWHVELAFDMSDFDWDHPLVLGGELSTEEAIVVLRRILVDGESTERIDEVCNGFRDISESAQKETGGQTGDDK